MDSFPDIRSFSTDELKAYLAALFDAAEQAAGDPPQSSGYEQHVSDNVPLAYRRQVLNNKIELVRAELTDRGEPRDPGNA